MSVCAPNVDVSDHYTCFELNELKQIALAFNIFIQTNKICSPADKNICAKTNLINVNHTDKKKLWNDIYDTLKPICKYEYCWIDLDFINLIRDPFLQEKVKMFTFKPQMTLERYSWLSTQDINSVMQQYEKHDPNFEFLGALPSDFYKLHRLNYKSLANMRQFSAVLNLDTHNQPGSHWVAFFADNKSKTLEYFDSAGKQPNKHITKFFDKLVKNYFKKYHLFINDTKHQKHNSECGVYATYYIIQRLKGYSFDQITKHIVDDETMNQFRDYIFRPRN